MASLVLDCGVKVDIHGFNVSTLYGGQLEGRPNSELNTLLVGQARFQMQPLWGKRTTHLIQPAIIEDARYPLLPSYCLSAWLISGEENSGPFCGSQLVVVWFRDKFDDLPLSAVIAEAVKDLPWESLATDFDY
jgi:hypothetical protein